MTAPALRLRVLTTFFSYMGNSGGSGIHTDIMEWWVETVLKAKADPRVESISYQVISTTPVTMSRNLAVVRAREAGAHVSIWIDSDQNPQLHKHESWFKPFWDVAFDEIYNHYHKGPLVVCSPYVGSPASGENCFVFQWANTGIRGDETQITLEQFTREEAAKMRGVHEIAAAPTGLIMCDMRAFELIEPSCMSQSEVLDKFKEGELSKVEALAGIQEGWCHYEYETGRSDRKKTAHCLASTEDVQLTRDISMAGQIKLGYNPIRCAFDSWIGHWKPVCVGKPMRWDVNQIAATFQRVVLENRRSNENVIEASSITDANFWNKYESAVSKQVADSPNKWPTEQHVPSHENPPDHKTSQAHLDALANLVRGYVAESGKQTIHIIEIGSWKGDSAIAMLRAHEGVTMTCVDTWKGSPSDKTYMLARKEDVFSVFKKNIQDAGFEHRVIAERKSSRDASFDWRNKADIIFIDAEHTYDALTNDIMSWIHLVCDDGLLVGHDYCTVNFPGVTNAVNDIFGAVVKSYGWNPNDGGFWVVRKSEYLAQKCQNQDSKTS